MGFELGLVEGFYGPLWPPSTRTALVSRLGDAGYRFYHYAPKADPAVREHWRQPWPDDAAAALAGLRRHCRGHGLRFGVGLTPLGAELPLGAADRRALADRLAQLDAIGIDELLVGFDDLAGDRPDLAARQAELAHWCAARIGASRVCICPTYYADDPLLDRLFGERPPGYLSALGRHLDPAIGVYWAGEGICPASIDPAHIERVAGQLRRPPLLWDNYPVNDGPAMAPHLHLRAVTGRPEGLRDTLAGHAVNPALQPTLTAIPALTLAERYRLGAHYDPDGAFSRAARAVLGDSLAATVEADLPLLQDAGLNGLGAEAARLRASYARVDHPAAREIIAWLDGHYAPAGVPTQP